MDMEVSEPFPELSTKGNSKKSWTEILDVVKKSRTLQSNLSSQVSKRMAAFIFSMNCMIFCRPITRCVVKFDILKGIKSLFLLIFYHFILRRCRTS